MRWAARAAPQPSGIYSLHLFKNCSSTAAKRLIAKPVAIQSVTKQRFHSRGATEFDSLGCSESSSETPGRGTIPILSRGATALQKRGNSVAPQHAAPSHRKSKKLLDACSITSSNVVTMKTRLNMQLVVQTTIFTLTTMAASVMHRPLCADDTPVRIASFDVDATPPLGSPMAYDPVKRLDELTLRCRGIALWGNDKPIVLCAVDWIGIANESQDAFRDALAEAVGTTRDRVAVHALHQHDAPGADFTAEKLIQELGLTNYGRFKGDFHRDVIHRAAGALRKAAESPTEITHVSFATADVIEVASNRRILGENGKVRGTRTSATKSAELRAEPEGVIDPQVSVIGFWKADRPIAVLSYYACHPQSYYRLGIPSPDFPGIARFIRGQDVNEALHVHFNGAGGNVTAGKYNDGTKSNRMLLATRLATGMEEAWKSSEKQPIRTSDIDWFHESVSLPPAPHLNEADLIAGIQMDPERGYISKVDQLAWLRRSIAGAKIDVSCLKIGKARILHLPGELFVEYQLAAKKMRPDLFVAMAAYGEYGPGYIGTAVSYSEGGYETAPTSSSVDPRAEPILLNAIEKLLDRD